MSVPGPRGREHLSLEAQFALGNLRDRLDRELGKVLAMPETMAVFIAAQGGLQPELLEQVSARLLATNSHLRVLGAVPRKGWGHLAQTPLLIYLLPLFAAMLVGGLSYALAASHQRVLAQAMQDQVTGLANRRLFNDRLHLAIAVARVGGDEFALILPELANAADAVALAERVLQALSDPFVLSRNQSVGIGACVGVAWFPKGQEAPAGVFTRADQALYRGKRGGRGQVCVDGCEQGLDLHPGESSGRP